MKIIKDKNEIKKILTSGKYVMKISMLAFPMAKDSDIWRGEIEISCIEKKHIGNVFGLYRENIHKYSYYFPLDSFADFSSQFSSRIIYLMVTYDCDHRFPCNIEYKNCLNKLSIKIDEIENIRILETSPNVFLKRTNFIFYPNVREENIYIY